MNRLLVLEIINLEYTRRKIFLKKKNNNNNAVDKRFPRDSALNFILFLN